ncbi:unnamed protein product [Camellia sinensis]
MRDQLWDNLEDVAGTMGKPWLVAGDFNDFATQRERRSFTSRNSTVRNQKFLDRVNNCNLMDLGSSGPSMTWTNNRKGLANTMERLDRAMQLGMENHVPRGHCPNPPQNILRPFPPSGLHSRHFEA